MVAEKLRIKNLGTKKIGNVVGNKIEFYVNII